MIKVRAADLGCILLETGGAGAISNVFKTSNFVYYQGQTDQGKQITSPGWMLETSAQGWCTGKTQRDGMEREVGGGIGMGNTCKSMADSCQCMTKTTTILQSN